MNFDQNEAEIAANANANANPGDNIADHAEDIHFDGIWEDWYWNEVMQEIDDVPLGIITVMK